jgi:hypothetical protein
MVLQLEPLISTIFGFPDPCLFQQCGLPHELTGSGRTSDSIAAPL